MVKGRVRGSSVSVRLSAHSEGQGGEGSGLTVGHDDLGGAMEVPEAMGLQETRSREAVTGAVSALDVSDLCISSL